MKMMVTGIIFAVLAAVSVSAETVSVSTTNGVGGISGYVGRAETRFNQTQWHVKNQGTASTTRKGYIRFDTSTIDLPAGEARLDLVVSLTGISGENKVNVYGITDQSLDEVALTDALSWANAPGNDTNSAYAADLDDAMLLGTLRCMPSDVAGTVISFSSGRLTDLINADTNGLITLVLGRLNNNGDNLLFASEIHAEYAPPTLKITERSSVAATTRDGTGGVSGHVNYVDGGDFGNAQWHVKNVGASSLTRKGYIRFDSSSFDFTASNASLNLVVSLEGLDAGDIDTINVYGITDQSLDLVPLTNGLPWADAPANDIGSGYAADLNKAALLGAFTYQGNERIGLYKSFRSQALVDFLNADTNGLVTLVLGRVDLNGVNLLFAGETHSAYAPPMLGADRGVITLLNSASLVDATQATNKISTISFDCGASADKLVVQVCYEGALPPKVISYNGVDLTLAGTGGFRNKGIYYLDNPYTGGAADLYVESDGLANGVAIGVVSLSGAATGVVATASSSSLSVMIDAEVEDCFVMASYADQDEGVASAESPLTPLYGGAIGSARAAAGFVNGISLVGSYSYWFTGSGGSPESYVAFFAPAPPHPMGTVILIN